MASNDRLWAIGSMPSASSARAISAFSRARSRLTPVSGPSPISRILPEPTAPGHFQRNMKTQRLAPLGSTTRQRFLPSLCRPGSVSVSTLRALSLLYPRWL